MKRYIKYIILGISTGIVANLIGLEFDTLSWWGFILLCDIIGVIIIDFLEEV